MTPSRLAPDRTAAALTVTLCLIWASQQVVIKLMAPAMAPVLQIGTRAAIAALLLLGWLGWRRRGALLPRHTWVAGSLAGVLFGIEFVAIAEGLRLTSASHVVVFLYTAPIFTALGLHWLAPGEQLNPRQWAGLLLAVGGIVVAFAGDSDASSLLGDAIALLGGLAWGLTTVVIRASTLDREPPAANMFWQMGFTALCCLGFAVLSGQTAIDWRPEDGWLLAWQIVVIGLLSYAGWFWLLDRYLASRIAALALLTPLFGVAMGVVILDEQLRPGFLAGAAMVSIGLAAMRLSESR